MAQPAVLLVPARLRFPSSRKPRIASRGTPQAAESESLPLSSREGEGSSERQPARLAAAACKPRTSTDAGLSPLCSSPTVTSPDGMQEGRFQGPSAGAEARCSSSGAERSLPGPSCLTRLLVSRCTPARYQAPLTALLPPPACRRPPAAPPPAADAVDCLPLPLDVVVGEALRAYEARSPGELMALLRRRYE